MGHTFHLPVLASSLASLLLACGTTGGEEPDTTEASTAVGMPMTDSSSTSAVPPGTTTTVDPTHASSSMSTSTGDSGVDTIAPPLFDLGVPDMPPTKQGCNKVDFLFVIDDSSSMAPYQLNLVSNFPAFIDGIQSSLDTTDSYQVGVVTTDPYAFNVAGCQQLSSLVVQTGGASSSNMVCGPYADGNNFMTENDELAASFSCAAAVGSSGSGNEQPQRAIVEAVQRIEGGPGECNEGFIRDDALLVIVYVGNENDNSPGTPQQNYDAVLAAKLDIPENVVVVAITDYPGNPCSFGGSPEMAAFTDLWGANGFKVPICDADYGPSFDLAIDIIDVACENFIPPID